MPWICSSVKVAKRIAYSRIRGESVKKTRAVAAFALLFCAFGAGAQYPTRPVRVILAVPAGGTPDVMARTVTPAMSRVLGQQLVVDNRAGAGGLIGAELAAKAAPDGYTLLVSSPGPLTIIPHMQKQLAYDPLRDLVAIGLISSNPFLLITNATVPARSVKELLALAKTSPGKLNYASAGNGAANHLAMELFKSMSGIEITHVPYKGAPQAVTDVVAGHMNMMFNSIPPMLAHIRAERVRALGVGSMKRSTQLPDVPTINEAGVPGYESITWFGFLAPSKTPKPILTQLTTALSTALATPETRALVESQGMDAGSGHADEFAALIRREYERNAKVVRVAKVRVD
jgi:tripartite-type tricarboxylate transporter receptor subunit TctC